MKSAVTRVKRGIGRAVLQALHYTYNLQGEITLLTNFSDYIESSKFYYKKFSGTREGRVGSYIYFTFLRWCVKQGNNLLITILIKRLTRQDNTEVTQKIPFHALRCLIYYRLYSFQSNDIFNNK